jgi:hypothetical protein
MRVIDDAGSTGLKRLPAECYAPPLDFVADVERSLKEACAVEVALPEWRPPSKEQQRLEARAAASSQRIAGKATAPKPKPITKQLWRQRVARAHTFDHVLIEEQRRYEAALKHLQKQLSFVHGIEDGLCCVPSRARTLERAAAFAEWRKAERYLWACERP